MSNPLSPVLLRADNFTPPSRTPWGGRRIVLHHRTGLDPAAFEGVGEAWEFSLDEAFPSRVEGSGALGAGGLAELFASDPHAWLGDARAQVSLLLKLIDAADRLSVQVHPSDTYHGLDEYSCGKPEAWLIVAHEPGAGIWLGLADGVQREDVTAALDAGQDLAPFLNFVPVEVGDAFLIAPGTVHAIGAGVTLVEPQLVHPRKAGLTYRFWDWGRRYNTSGVLDPAGQPRALHREDALAVTAWDGLRGAAFVDACRAVATALTAPPGIRHARVLTLGPVVVERLQGEGLFDVPTHTRLTILYVLKGSLTLSDGRRVAKGRTLVVPAALGSLRVSLEGGADVLILSDGGLAD